MSTRARLRAVFHAGQVRNQILLIAALICALARRGKPVSTAHDSELSFEVDDARAELGNRFVFALFREGILELYVVGEFMRQGIEIPVLNQAGGGRIATG